MELEREYMLGCGCVRVYGWVRERDEVVFKQSTQVILLKIVLKFNSFKKSILNLTFGCKLILKISLN